MINVNWETGADSFIDAVASCSAVPGGGAAAAVVAATGCGLCTMAVAITMKMKSTAQENKKILSVALDELCVFKDKLKAGAIADAKAYENVVSVKKLPQESKEREILLKEALQAASLVPLDNARAAADAIKKIREVENFISPVIMSDILCGKTLLKSAIECFIENIKTNILYIKDENSQNEFNEALKHLSSAVEI
jgi:formiminotetrahydrofolate cyclodeaminase